MSLAGQTFIPGTEPPAHDADIESALDSWLDAKRISRAAADDKRTKHAILIARMQERNVEEHRFVCPQTGKRKRVRAVAEVKAKVSNAPREKSEDESFELEAPVRDDTDDGKVEMRRVSRASVAAEIDPFAATRGSMASDAEH